MAEDNAQAPQLEARSLPRLDEKWAPQLRKARALVDEGKEADAWVYVAPILLEEPHNAAAIVLATHVLDKARRLPEAYAMAHMGAHVHPNIASMWTNLARMCDQLYLYDECDRAAKKAIDLAPKGRVRAMQLMNWGAALINQGRWEESEKLSREALAVDDTLRKAKANLGMACLAQGKWREGWANYKFLIGSEMRKRTQYGEEPEWDGTPGQVVAITGEQGLGDEISFFSMVPDAIRACKRVIIDCDKRLEGLFRRSFPQATVYGTRWEKELDWEEADRSPDASLLVGQLGQFFRNEDSDFDGKPYLQACPIRTAQWVDHFRKVGKMPVGIAWTGGVQWTGGQFRMWELSDLKPIFDALPDAYFVSLQYKDASAEIQKFKKSSGIDVHQFKWATLTKDYDDTAALVAAIGQCGGLVISMQTAVIHLAGALGVPCWVFVHKGGQWRYGIRGKTMPWYDCVHIFRQTKEHEWSGVIEDAGRQLRERYGGTQGVDRVRPAGDGGSERARALNPAAGKKSGSNLLRQLVAASLVEPAKGGVAEQRL